MNRAVAFALMVVPTLLGAAITAAASSSSGASSRPPTPRKKPAPEPADVDQAHEDLPAPPEPQGGVGIVPKGRVSSPFGADRSDHVHAGIDIVAPLGAPVRAAAAGVVVDISPDGKRKNYGNLVIVSHAPDELTVYAHLQDVAPGLHVGQVVDAGTLIGHVGQTHAPSTSPMGAHVHFEVLAEQRMAAGRIIVNRDTLRHEPQAWLEGRGGRVSDV